MDLHVLDHVPDIEETDARPDVFMRITYMRRGIGDKLRDYHVHRKNRIGVTRLYQDDSREQQPFRQ
jgi:hypothetical protein